MTFKEQWIGFPVQVRDGVQTQDASPGVWSLFICVAGFIRARAPKAVIYVTSIKRNDKGTHGPNPDGRSDCIDFDVIFDGVVMEKSQAGRAVLGAAKAMIDGFFPYGIGGDGLWHHTFVWETFDGEHNSHVHLQLPWEMRSWRSPSGPSSFSSVA